MGTFVLIRPTQTFYERIKVHLSLDIPGHMAGVRTDSPLHAHTCKHGIWNQDGRFDVAALGNGVIRMPHYELCLQAEDTSIGARLRLAECSEAELQTWTLQDSGEISLEAAPQMCITIEEGPGRNAGGPRYLMKSVGRDQGEGGSCRSARRPDTFGVGKPVRCAPEPDHGSRPVKWCKRERHPVEHIYAAAFSRSASGRASSML